MCVCACVGPVCVRVCVFLGGCLSVILQQLSIRGNNRLSVCTGAHLLAKQNIFIQHKPIAVGMLYTRPIRGSDRRPNARMKQHTGEGKNRTLGLLLSTM
jgi:hypothetical protein